MNWKQFLTEKVLGECWDADKRPGGDKPNRTFDNRNDLMDLYEAIEEDGKIEIPPAFTSHFFLFAWIFHLDGKGYEERCKAVAEFYGWNEQRDPVIDKNSGAYGDN